VTTVNFENEFSAAKQDAQYGNLMIFREDNCFLNFVT
jgi:hypothetical protein